MLSRLRCVVAAEKGVTVIELLIAVLVVGVVGAVATSGIVGGMQASRRGQDRVQALTELQTVTERMSRELRAADPVVVAEDDEITVDVCRDERRYRYRYRLDATDPTRLVQSRGYRDPADSPTLVSQYEERPFAEDLDNQASGTPVFAYADRRGDPPSSALDIATITITLERRLREAEPVAISTAVNVRNEPSAALRSVQPPCTP